jgi:hypothetical protein
MPKSSRHKKKQPPIETSDNESTFTFSAPSPSPSPFPSLFGTGEKRGHPQSSTEKENQKPAKKTTKQMTFTAGIPSISFPPLSPKQHLQKALESLTQAYKGLEEEKKEEEKEQVKQLEDYTRSILVGENPFIKGKEKAKDILQGLVEEVRALRKEVAPTKETYAERLKKNLPSSSSLPSLPLPSPTPSTSTRSKKKQLQERKLVLITDQKDQPLDTL